MKLKRFTIENYKALGHLDVRIDEDFLFLIGVNGAGKSSLLQALSLVRYFSEGATSSFFKDRGWKPSDARPRTTQVLPLRSANSPSPQRARNLAITLAFEYRGRSLLWIFEWSYKLERTIAESIWVQENEGDRPRNVLNVREDDGEIPDALLHSSTRVISTMELELSGSILAVLRPRKIVQDKRDGEMLEELRAWAGGITSLEMLSPSAMRNRANLEGDDIGAQGERLPSFLANLSPDAKSRVVERVSRFYPIEDLDTTRKRAGWIDMRVAESFKLMGRIDAAHMSDGFLRILALCAIPEFGEDIGLVLLDEVEDGIEPHILPRLIERIAKESPAQLIMTSHSPLLVNFFEPKEIFLLGRDRSGHSVGASAASLKPFREGSEFFGAGEIWANSDLPALNRALPRFRLPRRSISDSPTPREVARYLEPE